MKGNLRRGLIVLLLVFGIRSYACLWDSKTLWEEKHDHPTLAEAILHPKIEQADIQEPTSRIQKLREKPETNDPAWWNDLAGAYIRLGRSAEAVKILEPITNRFSGDYGIHATLGTAYHLLGRYADAEKEIRHDLEINPEGHHGLEKYHLALLQYLSQDAGYRARHVYVDEFTQDFLRPGNLMMPNFNTDRKDNSPNDSELRDLDTNTFRILIPFTTNTLTHDQSSELWWYATQDVGMQYSTKWDLGKDSKLEAGVIYMATLNPNEPSCWIMLGMVARKKWDLKLAEKAFQKAIDLGTPQSPILRTEIKFLAAHETNFFYYFRIFGIPARLWIFLIIIISPIWLLVLIVRLFIGAKAKSKTTAS